jgi:predicted acylesterase/phospholipase RssA
MSLKLPKSPFHNLALSLSGGGYRAASFHLGALSYLSSVEWMEKSLLERVRVLSTVSGGTFTGVCYATTLAEGKTLKDCYDKLYGFMSGVDLIDEGLKKLEDFDKWKSEKSRSLINAFSLVYYDKLEQNTFALLFDREIHIKEIIFNATEFTYGLPFRFTKTSLDLTKGDFALLGNYQVNMPYDAEREVRLADVIAASSCFPMGFEPINYPHDFRYSGSLVLDHLKHSYRPDRWGEHAQFPIGLMDGGIDDNQGINSVKLAEERMKKNPAVYREAASDDEKAIDLFLISDVASPYMDAYIKTKEKKPTKWRKWNFSTFRWMGILSLVLGAGAVCLAFLTGKPWCTFIYGFIAALLLLAGVLGLEVSSAFMMLLRKFDVPGFFTSKLKAFTRMRFGIYETLIRNRISSVQSMVSEVFMKQIRRREYDMVYEDKDWETRLIMNAIYDLSEKEVNRRDKEYHKVLSEELRNPSQELIETAGKAKSMGTTLWFTPKELKDNPAKNRSMLNTLIACGQFTACFNLLDYIEKVLWNPKCKESYTQYPDALKNAIKGLHGSLLADWKRFNEDPYWMTAQYNHSQSVPKK